MPLTRRAFLTGATATAATALLAAPASARTRTRALGTQNWMAGIDAGTPLQRLTIPGTHDSGARFGGWWVECQNTTLGQQLGSGIRFLDIRCRAFEGSFTIHHGAFYQNLNFDDVLGACRDFLRGQPTETVLMRVKQEYSQESDATFRAIFDDYLDRRGWRSLFHIGDGWPRLGDVRGKVVLIADNGGLPGGIRWGDGGLFDIQDDYNAVPAAKFPKIEAHFRKAAAQPGKQYINFVSTAAAIPPRWNADDLNPRTHTLLESAEGRTWHGLGIVPMDYPNTRAGLVESLIAHN
ncbi:phosphatidylinositol-specific phospholipase C [Streptomyces flavofungini]|uniref:phosphatidylinositol-specific phospholipase C n=1 Tax=Streptomyces flavofungini TaxID=68200 RepID=UPI0025B21B27|nr:phosphatidylinositol-specific phospholipase C [Streptomyces flavofungini]WJV46039.1 phosphatidylinositol-specific phospholipase C [Streptomyces flavofungini]